MIHQFGPLDSKLWFISDMPSVEEVETGASFTGAPARYIREKLGAIRYFGEFHYHALLDYRPPQGNFDLVELDPGKNAKLMGAVADLKDLIRTHKPNCVIIFGEKLLKYFLSRTDISSWRGHVVWSDELNCKILPTYHPSSAMRQRFEDKSSKPGQWDILCQTDIGKGVGESFSPILERPPATVVIARDYLTMMSELRKLQDATALAFDIETDRSGQCITCISFAPSPSYSVCIPLRNIYPGNVVVDILPPDQKMDVWWLVKQLLESPIPKIAQNSQFDMTVLRFYYGIRVCNLVWDTMVAAHNAYVDLPKDLGTLISIYSKHPQHKPMGHSNDLEQFWEYNARDSMVTFDIYLNQRKEMEELGILDHYIHVTNPLITCLVDMQCVGVKVDTTMRDAAVAREQQLADAIIKGIQFMLSKWFPDGFNPNSPQQKQTLFYSILGMKPIYTKARITTDADALEEFKERLKNRNPLMVRIIDCMKMYIQSKHLISVLNQTLINGRTHTAYDAAGTDTGRLNSRASITGSGGNLQNLQVGPPRQMLIPG